MLHDIDIINAVIIVIYAKGYAMTFTRLKQVCQKRTATGFIELLGPPYAAIKKFN